MLPRESINHVCRDLFQVLVFKASCRVLAGDPGQESH